MILGRLTSPELASQVLVVMENDPLVSSSLLTQAHVMGLELCELMVIQREDMHAALRRFPMDAGHIRRMCRTTTRARRDSLGDVMEANRQRHHGSMANGQGESHS